MSRPRRVLTVCASPDVRPSTPWLRRLLEEFERRPDVQSSVWFLRADDEERWTDSRVVDDLRTSWFARLLDLAGAAGPAARLRGLILRSWWWQDRPDIVILDDGLGERVIPHGRQPVIIARRNSDDVLGVWAVDEPDTTRALLEIVPQGPVDTPPRGTMLPGEELTSADLRNAITSADDVRRGRSLLGLPDDALVVASWGEDVWLDGADQFLRTLWAIEARVHRPVHGVWFGPVDQGDRDRLRYEAMRLGRSDRTHFRPAPTPAFVGAADAALLLCRAGPTQQLGLPEIALSGLPIVTYEAAIALPGYIEAVRPLDPDAAAERLIEVIAEDRWKRSTAAFHRFHVSEWVDRLFAAADEAGPRD